MLLFLNNDLGQVPQARSENYTMNNNLFTSTNWDIPPSHPLICHLPGEKYFRDQNMIFIKVLLFILILWAESCQFA